MFDSRGFTLVELMMSMLIIAILSTIGTMYLRDIRNQAADRQASTEGRHLLTAISDAVLGGEDVVFGDGSDTTGDIGTTDTGGGSRPAIFHASNDVRVSINGSNTDDPGDAVVSLVIWSVNGTPDPGAANADQRKEYVFYVDEANAIVSMPNHL